MPKQKPQIEFLANCSKVHGDRYDYSLVKYIGSKIKVKSICKIHGMFKQIPNGSMTECFINTVKPTINNLLYEFDHRELSLYKEGVNKSQYY